jgi:methionyl-tRNA synthetase
MDRYIVAHKPWELAKQQKDAELDEVLGRCFAALKVICELASPVIPESAARIQAQLAGGALGPIFPRADAKEVIPKMLELEKEELARQAQLLGKAPVEEMKVEAPAEPMKMMVDGVADLAPEITIDDFIKVDLRVGIIVSAEAVPKADKLLHLKIDIGETKGPRTIVAGIALAYKPEQLIGRKVAIVANLAPRKLRGIESQGMIVAASLEGGSPALVSFLEEVPVGARLK